MSDFISINDLANNLGVCHMTVYRMVKRGDVTAYKVGKKWVVTVDSVMEYLKAQSNTIQPIVT